MKIFRRFSAALLFAGLLQLPVSSSGADTPSFSAPDAAVLSSVTGLSPGTGIINDTVNGDALFINAYYSPTDRWLESYVNAGSTITLNWVVTGSNGAPLVNQAVSLISNLNYSGANGTSWQQPGLNANPSGVLTGVTDANGLVSFTITNSNANTGSRPADTTSTSGAEANEGLYPWTCMVLQIGNDVWTAATTMTVAKKTFTYAQGSQTLSATVKSSTNASSLLSGSVAFSTGGSPLCTATLTSQTASCTIGATTLDAGVHTLTASYSGNSAFAPHSASTLATVGVDSTTLKVARSVASVPLSNLAAMAITTSLTAKYGAAPSGNVTLSMDGTLLSNNAGSFSFSSLVPSSVALGVHTITVHFNGDNNYKPASAHTSFSVTAATSGLPVTNPSFVTNYDVSHGSLVWSETFAGAAGTALNSTYWTPEIGQGTGVTGVAPNVLYWYYGTGEIETNTADAANVSSDGSGNLAITARCTLNCTSSGNWTSARVSTAGKLNFEYGQIEANIKMPAGSFNWPAFWMLGQNFFPSNSWPNCGEIDVMEGLAAETSDQSTLHANYPGGGDWNGGGGLTARAPLANLSSAFHTFGMIWTPTSISFTLDGFVFVTDVYSASTGTVTQTFPNGASSTFTIGGAVWPFNQPFFLILQDAIPGGTTAPNGTSATMDVNWIKYYKYQGLGGTSI